MNRNKRIFRKEAKLFSISLLVALCVWLVYLLNTNDVHTLGIPIQYSNIPEDLDLIPLQKDTIFIKTNIKLWEYLTFDKDLSSYTIDIDNIISNFYVPNVESIKDFDYKPTIEAITPDTLFFKISPTTSKTVPIRFNSALLFKKNKIPIAPIKIKPSIAKIKGADSIINQIDFVSAEIKEFSKLDGSKKITLKIKAIDQVQIKPTHIDISFDIQDSVDRDTTLILSNVFNEDGKFILSPSILKVNYSFPINYLDSISPEFSVSYLKAKDDFAGGFRKIKVSSPQFFTKINSTQPPYVQFIKKKN